MVRLSTAVAIVASSTTVFGYAPSRLYMTHNSGNNIDTRAVPLPTASTSSSSSRRGFVTQSVAFVLGTTTASLIATTNNSNNIINGVDMGGTANAVGPIKINIVNPTYTAAPCPPSKPIPGEKAMKGMRGLCVQVTAELEELPPKELEKVGVYGYVNDAETSESVLANNPDSGTDAGQFGMIESVGIKDKKVEFEFIAAVPMEKDVTSYENGIGPLEFKSLRIISFPGGQQFGAINPCEMNEFSEECEVWEQENGPYSKGEFIMKSNPRTKGR
eukprot:scaffold13330_cov205-Alexandrium_tamarense.AAC.17